MNRKYNLKLDLQFRCNNSTMKFNQFDNNTSDFFMRITNGGNLIDIEKAIVVLAIIKPSGKVASQFVEVENGLVYADLKPNMRDEIGIYTAQAMLILEDERVVTDVISYEVEEDKIFSLLNDTVGTSEEFTLLTDMLSRLSAIEISEEQRVINEAERILSEENRKIEEAKRVEAELIRQHEEADRAKYDATRESNENIRKINEEARISSENVRLENEANRIEQEANRVKAEQLRKDNYNLMTEDEERRRSEANAHKEAEVLRFQAETNRVNEEAKRRTTEQARVSAENTRVSNENTRKANETTRQTNETHRVEAETQRQNRYNSFILEAEANANNFENYTNNAKIKEEERKSNELNRKSQEDRRVSNEVERISNENTRKANENARIESEKQRVDAENLRKEKIVEIQSDYDSLKKVIIDENASANLQNQINQTNSQLEHKANKDEVVRKGYGTLNDFDEETRRIIQGMDSGQVNAVLGLKNVNFDNMSNDSIDFNNFRDKNVSLNLFNKYSKFNTDGAMLDANGSLYTSASNMFTSDYIEVKPGTTIGFFSYKQAITSNLNVVLYNGEKVKISVATNVQGYINTTEETQYIRFSCLLANKQMVVVKYGTDITEHEDFSVKLNGLKIDNLNIEEKSIENNSIQDNTLTPNKMTFVEYGKNLLDKSKLVDGVQLDNNGNLTEYMATERTSLDFLEVSPNTTFTLTAANIKVAFFNKFKTFISSVTTNTFTTTEDTCYIRITMHINSKETAQLELGDKQTSYESYCVKIPLLKDTETENNITNIKSGLQKANDDITNIKSELQKANDDIIELQNISLSGNRIKVNLGNLFNIDESLTVSEVSTKTSTSSIDNSVKIDSITGDVINPIFRYCNAQVGKAGEIFPRYNFVSSYSVTGSNGQLGGSLMTVEFDIDCKEFELITLGTGTSYRLAIDEGKGFMYTSKDKKKLSEPDGSGYLTKIVFNDKKIRRVRFEIYNGIFGGVYIKRTDTVFPISLPRLPLACYTGSSITEGGYPWYVSQILGMDCINAGVGGTGYVNPGPLNRLPYIDRADNDLIKPNPDLIVIEGGINDSGYAISEVVSEADRLYKYIKEQLPNVRIIVIGMYWPRSASQSVLDMNSALRETCLNNQISFIDLLQGDTVLPNGALVTENMGAFLTGSGHAGNPQGDGNADIYTCDDATHPTEEGKLYISQRIATEIYKILQYI